MSNPLKVISTKETSLPYSGKQSNKLEMQAKFDRLWLICPDQFNPNRNCMERERVARTWQMAQKYVDLKGKNAVDLGCGAGTFSRMLAKAGATVDAVDISSNAMKYFEKEGVDGVHLKIEYVPHTLLEDDAYDLVLASDLLAHLKKNEYRLFISELARLVKPQGFVVCSTPIDVYSEGAVEKFASLMETEFNLIDWKTSHHSWLIRMKNFFEAPHRFAKGSRDREYREFQLKDRNSLNRFWYKLNSTKPLGVFWTAIAFVLKPVVYVLKQNRSLMLMLEKMASFISSEGSISHAIIVAQRRPIILKTPQDEIPEYHKGKKQIWE